MADNELDDTSRVIGGLETAVKNLTETWLRQDEAATRGRHQLYEKFDELKEQVLKSNAELTVEVNRRVGALEGRVDTIARDLYAMKPRLDSVSDTHQQGIGSKKALAAVWVAIIGLSGTVAALGMKAMELLWPAVKH